MHWSTVPSPRTAPRQASAEWLALSRRSLASSNGATSSTTVTPTADSASSSLASAKRRSITHSQKASVPKAAWSFRPKAVWAAASRAGVAAGTMRSTMLLGNAQCPAIQRPSAAPCPSPSPFSCTSAWHMASSLPPLPLRLSQEAMVRPAKPAAQRADRPCTSSSARAGP